MFRCVLFNLKGYLTHGSGIKLFCNSEKFNGIHYTNIARQFNTSSKLKDYYKVLGVDRNASSSEIKKAYYKLAKKHHPDVNKNDKSAASKFQQVSEAYETLSDPQKKQQFDNFGSTDPNAFKSAYSRTNQSSNVDPEELFRQIFGDFGSQSSRSGFNRGFNQEDMRSSIDLNIQVPFEDAALGTKMTLDVMMMSTCPRCDGSKAEPGTTAKQCNKCNGSGYETISTGPFMMRSTCRYCHGLGSIIYKPCISCKGVGKYRQKQKIKVEIPPGIENNQTLRVPVGSDEIFLTVEVLNSLYYKRKGYNLYSDLKIGISQAILGGQVNVKGLHGNITINVPSNTSSHDLIRCHGKGISKNSHSKGDHYFNIIIKSPKNLTDQQKQCITQFAIEDESVNGTVNGLKNTDQGLFYFLKSLIIYTIVPIVN
ncbi:hypothetical protein A3Q56_04231 [Intoshia linei]|uniref:Uncharacterized protein n=1 Tax=Intoshia linei TaxID=1819745 RepID=A0A177B180_9BILA|nr:hypothetical protein A3Q56_04231 [Intoshia linei]